MAPARVVLALLAVAAALGAVPTQAQVIPYGPELQVNSYTTGDQWFALLSVAPDGSFVVGWCCGEPEPPAPQVATSLARRFDPEGIALGDEVAVGDQDPELPSGLASSPDGGFVVVWGNGEGGCPVCDPDYVKGRRLDADGEPLGGQFAISPPPGGGYTGDGTVAMHSDGSFVVTWYDYGLYGRSYDADGAPQVGITELAGTGSFYADDPVTAPLTDGGFLTVWWQPDPDTGNGIVRGRRYDADFLPLGPIFPVVDSDASFFLGYEVATASDGAFVVGWTSWESTSGYRIRAQRFAANGQRLGAPIEVESLPSGASNGADVALEPGGGFAVAWASVGSPGNDDSGSSVQLRRFAADGTPLGGQIQLNSYTTGNQFWPRIGVQPDGDLVVAWSSDGSDGGDSSGESVQVRRFKVPFFADGFESGDTSRWSPPPAARAFQPEDVSEPQIPAQRSLTSAVPAAVPSLRHSSRP
jgi:hypothetical protein